MKPAKIEAIDVATMRERHLGRIPPELPFPAPLIKGTIYAPNVNGYLESPAEKSRREVPQQLFCPVCRSDAITVLKTQLFKEIRPQLVCMFCETPLAELG